MVVYEQTPRNYINLSIDFDNHTAWLKDRFHPSAVPSFTFLTHSTYLRKRSKSYRATPMKGEIDR